MKAELPSISDYIVFGDAKESDWTGIVDYVEREKALLLACLEHCSEEHVLIGVGKYFADRLFTELTQFEGLLTMLLHVRPVFPQVIEIEPQLNRYVRIMINSSFYQQDEIIKKSLLSKMVRLGDSLGFKVMLPIDPQAEYLLIKCELRDLPL